MIIADNALLNTYRTAGYCESCGRHCKMREPHHIFTKGAGQLDTPINLVALGRSTKFMCGCHSKGQGGRANRERFLEIVATREGTTPADIQDVVWLLRRLPKRPTRQAIDRELLTLGENGRLLAVRTLTNAGKL
jgi:hypothetical protein